MPLTFNDMCSGIKRSMSLNVRKAYLLYLITLIWLWININFSGMAKIVWGGTLAFGVEMQFVILENNLWFEDADVDIF